jgi:hypothetical protein
LVQRSVGWKASMMKGLEGVCLLMVAVSDVGVRQQAGPLRRRLRGWAIRGSGAVRSVVGVDVLSRIKG